MAEIHVNDIGTNLVMTVRDQDGALINLATATDRDLFLIKPNGDRSILSPSLVTDGSDGQLSYATTSGDLNLAGWYEIQVQLTYATGVWSSNINRFLVHANI